MSEEARQERIEAARNRLGAYLDQLDEKTRRPGEKPLRQAVADQAHAHLAALRDDVQAGVREALERDRAGEELARRFHEAYERLAPDYGYETRRESAVPWEQVPEQNRALMVAVCRELLRGDGA